MKLLLNDKEIAYFLLSQIDKTKSCKDVVIGQEGISAAIHYVLEEQAKRKFNLDKMREKFKAKLHRGVEKDLRDYVRKVKDQLERSRDQNYKLVVSNVKYFIEKLGEDAIIESYKKSNSKNFVKSFGEALDPSAELIRRHRFTNYSEDCLIRNTVGNEELLISKIDNNYPFWFIDSGYTNFLEPNKKWHRVVRNHLHSNKLFEAPVDRLDSFKKFPQPWRTGGDQILIIEPGPFAANIFHVDLKTWKYDVEKELRKYTDKKIVFREKINKKTRTNLYQHLLDEDYHCLVNINSNAATESIWAGVPVITLDKHISNPVSVNSLSQINNLATPHLAKWLCALSYSQFTFDEVVNGTALKLFKKYHV
jgi:hypothetical protein